MKLKIAAWILVLSGIMGFVLTLISFYTLPMPLMGLFIFIVMSIIPLVIGIYVFKRKTWALWLGLIYFAIQVAWVKSESFTWHFEYASPISLFMSFKTPAGFEVGVNFVAIAMCIVFILLLLGKEK